MRISLHIVVLNLVGKVYLLPRDLTVAAYLKAVPLLRENDSRGINYAFITGESGMSGNSGSMFTYSNVITTFGHYKNRLYWYALFGGLALLKSNETSVSMHVAPHADTTVDEICDDIKTAIANIESDWSNKKDLPGTVDLYLEVKQTDTELIEKLQEVFAAV